MVKLSNINQIIWKSVDKTFDKLMPEDKAGFYSVLKEKYHLNADYIAQTYDIFHLALKENYPLKHYKIESEIVKTMHEDTLNGKYELTAEIEAFSLMSSVIQEDEKKTMELMKSNLDEIDKRRGILERELLSEADRIQSLNNFLKEVHESLNNEKERKNRS